MTLLIHRNVGFTDTTKYIVNPTLKIWNKWSVYQFLRAFYLTSHPKKFSKFIIKLVKLKLVNLQFTTIVLFGFSQVYDNSVLRISCRNHLCDIKYAGAARDIFGEKKKKIKITGLAVSLPLRPWNQEFTTKKSNWKECPIFFFPT